MKSPSVIVIFLIFQILLFLDNIQYIDIFTVGWQYYAETYQRYI